MRECHKIIFFHYIKISNIEHRIMNYKITTLIFIILCSIQLEIHAQIENIVFEGAGIRGIAYSGVLDVLTEYDQLAQIKNVGGTSAGAITALAVSIGYTSSEIDSIIFGTNFKKLNQGHLFFLGGIHRVNKKFGWYKQQKLTTWIEKIIENKTNNKDITFEELSKNGYKNLYVTGVSLNKQKVIIFSKDNYPKMKVKDAIRISMSIPLYFNAVWIDQQGKTYEKFDPKLDLDLMIDGGVLANLPIHLFDEKNNDNQFVPNPKTIAIRIDSDEQINNDSNIRELAAIPIRRFPDYLTALYTLLLESTNRNSLTDADWARTVSVSSKGIGPRIKKLSFEQKNMLKISGKKSMLEYLNKHT